MRRAAIDLAGICAALYLCLAACSPSDHNSSPSAGMPPLTPLFARPTPTPAFRLAPFRAPTPAPTVTATPRPLPSAGPLVWIGGEGCLSMLGPEGWRTFRTEGIVRDIAVDAQGNAIVAPGLSICDGRTLRPLLPRAPGGDQDTVAIDAQGRIWVGCYGGIAVLDGGQWTVIPIEGSGAPDKAKMVRDLAIDSHGAIWVATKAGLARYAGSAWRFYSESAGLASSIDCVMVDGANGVWVGHEKGLSVLRGNAWQHFPLDEIGFVRDLAAGRGGNILGGSLYHGILSFDGNAWTGWADASAGLPSDRITALAVDGLGRVWAGTRSGLGVYEGGRWLTYQETNSGLGDNAVSSLALGGVLQALPTPGPIRYGRLSGQVTQNRQPASGLRVLLCPDLTLNQTFGDSPCEDAPSRQIAETDADGRYAFERVPVGHYAVAAEVEPGRWVTQARVLSAVRYAVREGETTVLDAIEGAE